MTRCFRSDCIHNNICNRNDNNNFICEIENIDKMNEIYGSCRYFESRDIEELNSIEVKDENMLYGG